MKRARNKEFTGIKLGLSVLMIFGLFLYSFAQDAGENGGRKITNFGVEVQIPKYYFFEKEEATGTDREGDMTFATYTQKGALARLFLVKWSEEPIEYSLLLEGYKFDQRIGKDESIKINGHDAVIKEAMTKVTRPCGKLMEEIVFICEFYCNQTKRYFSILDFETTMEKDLFLETLKRVRCH